MDGIKLKFNEEKEKLPVGASKFMGNPDVGEDFIWPYFNEDGEEYDLKFLCQINCAEAAPFDKSGMLPQSGMLYFFYDLDGMPPDSRDTGAARALYCSGSIMALHEMLLTDHEGSDMSLREMSISFGAPGEDYHAVLCEAVPHGLQPILRVFAFETEQLSLRFEGKRSLCFYADKADLKREDFSETYARQE